MFKGFASVWTPVCMSTELRQSRPLSVQVAGTKIVLFRGADGSGMSVRVCKVRWVDLWDVDALDLTAYLRRIGVSERTPSHAALDELLVAHAATFTFDKDKLNLYVRRGIGFSK